MRDIGRSFRLPVAVAAALVFVAVEGCGSGRGSGPSSGSAGDKAGNRIILEVEGTAFRNADMDIYVRDNSGTTGLPTSSLSRLFDRFVEEKILLAAARKQGMSLTPAETKAYLDKLAGESPPDEKPSANRDEGSLLDRLLIEKYTRRVVGKLVVGDDEVHAFYEEHKREFLVPERIRVSQILLETENKAVEVLRRLENAPEEEFRRVAREESVGPEAFKGGAMGIFRVGDLPFEMEKVVFSLAEGRLGPVVESSYGFHVFRVDQKLPPELLTEAAAAPSIRLRILDAKVQDTLASHIQELERTLSWTSYPDRLSFAYQRNAQ